MGFYFIFPNFLSLRRLTRKLSKKGQKEMKLHIYGRNEDGKKVVLKTYETESYDLEFGIIEDVASVVNLDHVKTGSNAELIKVAGEAITGSLESVKALMADIFPGLTAEELRHVKVREMAEVLMDVILYTFGELKKFDTGKNA